MPVINLPTLIQFSSDRVDLHITFIPAVLHGAHMASTFPNQIPYEVMTDTERLNEFPATAPHVPFEVPPPIPDADWSESTRSNWENRRKEYQNLCRERNTFLR